MNTIEKIPAAPIPAMARETISIIMDYQKIVSQKTIKRYTLITHTLETPQSKEPNKKTDVPKIKIHFLPKMSENLENNGSRIKLNVSISVRHKSRITNLRKASNVKI